MFHTFVRGSHVRPVLRELDASVQRKGKKMWIKEGEARTLHGLDHDAGRRTEFGFVDLLHVLDLWVNDSDRNTASVSHFSQFRYPVRARRIAASDGAAGQKNCCLNVLVIF